MDGQDRKGKKIMNNYDLILDSEGNKMVLRPHTFGLNPAVSSDYIGCEQSYGELATEVQEGLEQVAASELKKAASVNFSQEHLDSIIGF